MQFKNSNIKYRLKLEKIQAKTFYTKHKKLLDKMVLIFNKYQINLPGYIKWFIDNVNSSYIDNIINLENIQHYAEELSKEKQYKKIYEYYLKSANNVAQDSIRNNLTSCIEYLKFLIQKNLLAQEYLSGRISEYYLASITNFKQVYLRLNQLNRDTLKSVYDQCDKLNIDVQNAFLYLKSQKVTPIQFTDSIILNMKQSDISDK